MNSDDAYYDGGSSFIWTFKEKQCLSQSVIKFGKVGALHFLLFQNNK